MISEHISPSKTRHIFMLLVLILLGFRVYAQDIEIHHRPLQRVGNTFESVWLIDNQTVLVPLKKTMEFDISHRFGVVKNGYKDFIGLYAPSNIRIGFSYVPIENLQLGFGFAKDRLLWDVSAKYALLKEQSGSPFSVSYFVNMAADTRPKDNFRNTTDRFSYFHQLMVARKVTSNFSVQAAISLSHFNRVEGYITNDLEIEGKMKNDHIAASVMGRYKLSDAFAFIANYDQPITKHPINNPNPNISFGFELATPMHAFQVFVGNYKWLVPQYSHVLNQNNYEDGKFLIGFNITRLMDLQEENMMKMMFRRKAAKKE